MPLLIKIILNKPKLYFTNLIYLEFRVQTFSQTYKRQILLYMFKVNTSEFQNLHCHCWGMVSLT